MRGLPEDFFITVGDTAPALTAILSDLDGDPLPNLDTATLKFIMSKTGFGAKVAVITDAPTAAVKYSWGSTDTDTAGTFRCYWQVTFTDASIQTVPADQPFNVVVTPKQEA